MVDWLEHNRDAWNRESRSGESPWCQPVDELTIAAAHAGQWAVRLTPTVDVPAAWFSGVRGKRVLCLASGGGQQAPVLAAAGALVTSFDVSEEQLAKDQLVADRDGLDIRLVRGDMTDLSSFEPGDFDLIFHPNANLFVNDVRTVWVECYRVLKPTGRLLAGLMNPDFFLFDHDALDAGEPLVVRNRLPFSEANDSSEGALKQRLDKHEQLVFSHSLDDLIGGQIDAGFVIAGLYEDRWTVAATRLSEFMSPCIATLGIKH